MRKLVISLVVILLAIASFFVLKNDAVAESYGKATFIIVDQSGTEVVKQDIDFDEGMTLFELLDTNFSVGCANDSYRLSDVCEKTTFGGHVILQLEDVSTDWYNSYISIYINDEYSTQGIDLIPLTNGDVYKFVYTTLGGDSSVD